MIFMKSFISKLEKKFSKMNKDLTKLFGIHQIKDCLEHDIFINIIVTCSLCLRNDSFVLSCKRLFWLLFNLMSDFFETGNATMY